MTVETARMRDYQSVADLVEGARNHEQPAWDALIERYVAAGLSKFVVRPAAPPPSLGEFLSDFNRELMPLQT